MIVNGKATKTNQLNYSSNKSATDITVNQPVTNKIHITKHKKDILRIMRTCFKEGGINGIKGGSMVELAGIIDDIFSFDYQGSTGKKTTKKESILRALKLCEQNEKED